MNKNNAFSNLVVLDLTRYLPGGYATQPFADWGANVIKVEDTEQETIADTMPYALWRFLL